MQDVFLEAGETHEARCWPWPRKELIHILRDPRSLAVAVLMPLAMVLIYGAAIDMELRDLPGGRAGPGPQRPPAATSCAR